jgi:hypothetical protein
MKTLKKTGQIITLSTFGSENFRVFFLKSGPGMIIPDPDLTHNTEKEFFY